LKIVFVQRDIERELKDFSTTVVQQIGNLATKQPELTSTIQLLFSQVHSLTCYIDFTRTRDVDIGPELPTTFMYVYYWLRLLTALITFSMTAM